MSALGLDRVTKRYAGGVLALDAVSVEVAEGQRVAVLGPSGSGKTTMLTIMGTLERPSAGHVRVAGLEVAGAPDA
jgi:putative ABC transport system ATP-binding protein